MVVTATEGRTAVLEVEGAPVEVALPARGLHYAVDAAAATAMAAALLGDELLPADIANGLASMDAVYGRGEILRAQKPDGTDEHIELIAMKNPPSLQVNLDYLDRPEQVFVVRRRGHSRPVLDVWLRPLAHPACGCAQRHQGVAVRHPVRLRRDRGAPCGAGAETRAGPVPRVAEAWPRYEDDGRELRADDAHPQAARLPRPRGRGPEWAPAILVVHLYPRELGINGDVGNVLALRSVPSGGGCPSTCTIMRSGESCRTSAISCISAPGRCPGRRPCGTTWRGSRRRFATWAAGGVPFLAIAGGWQLLGRQLVGVDGVVMPGADVFPTRATLTADRRVGEVARDRRRSARSQASRTTAAVTELLDGAVPFALVTHREGAGPAAEGVIVGSSIGTNLHGPLLPMNPAVADRLLTDAAALAGVPMGQDDDRIRLVDERASKSRDAIRRRLGAPGVE